MAISRNDKNILSVDYTNNVVLYFSEDSYQPYVTWAFNTEGDNLETYWGHYFNSKESAIADYNERNA